MQKTERVTDEIVELKPCPFCGGEALQCGNNEHNPRHWIMCRDCHACPGGDVPDLCEAVSTWNSRSSAEEKVVEGPIASFAWNEGVESAPYSTTVLATYFDMEIGEWIIKIFVAERPTAPFTHWMWIASPGEAAELPWRNMDSAPRTGEEFIARTGPGYPSFSCFWDGEGFSHYDKHDGFIRYPATEWLPMPTAAQQDCETRIRSALVDVPAVESEPVAWMFEGDAWGREVMLSEQEAIDRKERLSRTWDITITPLYTHPPRSSLIQSEEGEITLTIKEAEKLAARLEFDASWDKCGDGYYSIKNQLRALSTPPSPYGGDNGDGSATGTNGGQDNG
ncbi:Lar family restriction alleviation protein [Shinella sp. M27]|uniref:Lar family restriction alleviation protein n=1 Tax=Shinella sp. M27 TaxID=3368614 RepID=UPI003BA159E5